MLESPVLDIRMLHHSGIGVYLQGLLEGMARLGDAPRFVFYGPHEFRPEVPERLCELYALRNHRIYSLKEQFFFPERLRFRPLFHAPHYNVPLRFRGRLVVTMHDLNHLAFPEHLPSIIHRQYARFMFREAAIRARRIIAVSEHTRNQILERLKVEPERVSVIHYAVSADFSPVLDQEKQKAFFRDRGIPHQYLLAIGIHKPHKNHSFLVTSFADLWKSGDMDVPLVIAGLDEEGRKRLEILSREKGVEAFVKVLGRFSREEAPLLYSGAIALVFPSLYEGFGIPPLEAMKMNIPVICSNRPPMPEVVGDAALFFDPASEDELKGAVLRLLSDSDLRLDLVGKGVANLGRFDWAKTARQTLEVYHKVLQEA